MFSRTAFVNSEPVNDWRRTDGNQEDFDLADWNDTPPHENGEGWDGNGFGNESPAQIQPTGCGCTEPESPSGTAQPYTFVEP